MDKIDFKKELKVLYKPSAKKVDIVEVPKLNYFMVDGEGDPNTSQSFQDAIDVLYPLSYTLKFMIKKGELGIDYGVLPLEGLWWADDMSSFSVENKDGWKWTLMIMQPDFVTKEMVQEAMEQVKVKKNPVSLPLVRFESFEEGKVAQIMHIGPFSEEGPTVEKVHSFIEENGSQRRGKHHEIYLSDIRRAAPEKWKTIIRQPMS
ncbi:MAG: GyrI-like domain-containing protein [Sedimenticola sp.]